ncbi:MAG: twin-arginine translocase subunit TatC [Desulfobulbus sp.]|jgi:sec-independent protein translocase protein TatC|uniref:twin-arginine translocase subunit TatC n=1 Tax=Desulfobulbus sp. TaxID=895 RepID=UPI00283EBF62|nr:twin-arginine translocase subunit TatC [Desulfobulbus sp.]MDR2551401.1 twin-arginine translocase subunit TatC [Desulfobulbus sp.]
MNARLKSFAIFLLELRGFLKVLMLAIVGTTAALFFVSGRLLAGLQGHLGEKLYFFSVAAPFLSHVNLAFFGALYLLMPLCMFVLWKALGKPFGVVGKKLTWFVVATCVLFYGGTIFCAFVTLPFGISFLLGFQSEALRAVISVDRFVTFVTLFLFGFGVIFELPVFMVFAAQVGIITRKTFEKNRRYAVLAIAILAAVLTPTPDVFNMALMGVPLYLLYESGILLIRLMGLGERKAELAPPDV